MIEARPGGLPQFWTRTPEAVCAELHCGRDGLSTPDAEVRLGRYGPNADAVATRAGFFRAIARRLLEPLSLILLAAGIVSAVTGDTIGGSIIVTILSSPSGSTQFRKPMPRRPRRSCAGRWRSRRRSSVTAPSAPSSWRPSFQAMSFASRPAISSRLTRCCWKAKR